MAPVEHSDVTPGSPTADRVAAQLRQGITEGRLRPGQRLRDQAVAMEFDVSRHTARDALRILALEGLVASRMHSGYTVHTLNSDDVRDIFNVRRHVEASAIIRSSRAPDHLLSAMSDAVEVAEKSVKLAQWEEAGTASLAFHQAIVGLGNSARLNRFFDSQVAQLRLAFSIMRDEGRFQSAWIPRDRVIADLILSGRRSEAVVELDRYLDDSESQLIDALRETRNG